MSKVDTILLKGSSGISYNFDVYPWRAPFKSLGAVYAVLNRNANNYSTLYIGQTSDLSTRFENHHKQGCFDRNGKTHIGIHLDSSAASQLAKERDLVVNYNPVCND